MEFVVLFPACRRTDGQWPPLRVGDLKLICHLENGNVPTTSAGYNRDTAIATISIFNADWPCAEHRIAPPARSESTLCQEFWVCFRLGIYSVISKGGISPPGGLSKERIVYAYAALNKSI